VNSGCHILSLQFDRDLADLRASINAVKVDTQQQIRRQQMDLEVVRAEHTKACERIVEATARIQGLELDVAKETGEQQGLSALQQQQIMTIMEKAVHILQEQIANTIGSEMDRLSSKVTKLEQDVSALESTSGSMAGALSAPSIAPRQPFQGRAHSPRSASAPAYPDMPIWHSDSDDTDWIGRWRRVPPERQHLDDPALFLDVDDEDFLDCMSEDGRCDLLEERLAAVQMLPVEQRHGL
jgi:hypothetical protein